MSTPASNVVEKTGTAHPFVTQKDVLRHGKILRQIELLVDQDHTFALGLP